MYVHLFQNVCVHISYMCDIVNACLLSTLHTLGTLPYANKQAVAMSHVLIMRTDILE